MRRAAGVLFAALAVGALWLLWGGSPAAAGAEPPIVVTTADDVLDAGDGLLSLREAVAQAEADGMDAPIQLAAETTYQLTICGPEDGADVNDNAVNGLDHHGEVELSILGAEEATIEQTCPGVEVLDVEGTMVLRDVAVTGGHGGSGPSGTGETTALYAGESMQLDGVHLFDNDPLVEAQWVAFAFGPMTVTDSLVEDHDVPEGGYLGWVLQGDPLVIADSTLRENVGSIGVALGSPMVVSGTEVRANETWTASLESDCEVTITDSTLGDNVSDGDDGGLGGHPDGAVEVTGGAVFARGVATITGSAFDGNTSAYDGGAVQAGRVHATDTSFIGNTALGQGGAIDAGPIEPVGLLAGREPACGAPPQPLDGTVTLTSSTVEGNQGGDGAAIFAEGSLTLTDTDVTGNASVEPPPESLAERYSGNVVEVGGALTVDRGEISANTTDEGFIVSAAPITLTDVVVDTNTPQAAVLLSHEDIYVTDSELTGNTGIIGPVLATCDLVLDGVTATGNHATEIAGVGGSEGTTYLLDSTLEDNVSEGDAGAIIASAIWADGSTVSGNEAAGNGGGLLFDFAQKSRPDECGATPPLLPTMAEGEVTVADSTISGNTAGGDGGGLYSNGPTTDLEGSTISGNVAGGDGGGIAADFEVTLLNSTVTSNEAQAGGGIAVGADPEHSRIELRHTTVSANDAGVGDDVVGAFLRSSASAIGSPGALGTDCVVDESSSGANNVMTDTSCLPSHPKDRVVPSLGLGDLADNGGPTLTRLPGPTSAVVDRGCAAGVTTDQRGTARPLGTSCDAGAVESPWVRFSDVGPSHPFFDEISQLAADGVIGGYSDGTFRPSTTVSRQAAMAFLYRLSGSPEVALPSPPTFPDVGVDHPFRTEVEWAATEGVSEGYADGTFRPSAGVTRQALVAWLFDLVGPDFDAPDTPRFADVGSGNPFFAEIEWAAEAGVVDGYEDGTFRPGSSVTRQAAAAILLRARPLLPPG